MKLKMLGLFAAAALAAGCDDPLDVQPQQSLPAEEALNSAERIRVAVNGMYDALQSDGAYSRNLLLYPDLYTDNLRFTGTFTTDSEVFNRDILANNTAISGIWGAAYSAISRANNVVTAAPGVADLPAAERNTLEGEARFIRALSYMNLVTLFGGVPLVLEPRTAIDATVNVPRASEAAVWAQIETDLNAAIAGLADSRAGTKTRASRQAAQALLARAHLYQKEWTQARDLANAVITSGRFQILPNYADVFNTEQTAESIFELAYSITDGNSLAFWFYPRTLGGRRGVAPSNTGSDASPITNIFPTGDTRRALAIVGTTTGGYGNKYTDPGSGSDDVIVLRLAEMYLIRSEANARLGALGPAIADINVIRTRAGIGALPATVATQEQVLVANLEERRRELFYEGHRFNDLRRFADLAPVGSYIATSPGLQLTGRRLLFPIPQREIDANPELTQNPGY
jgi:hypothetical protein